MPVTRILLIRHGETDWNREARIQGHRDIPLNEIGRRQAEHLRARLAGEGIEAAYSSDLSRVYETARIALADPDLPIHRTAELREVSFGDWEGKRWAEVEQAFPEEVARYRREFGQYAPPGGESLTALRERAIRVFRRISADHRDRVVAVFSHGGPCRAILAHVLGLDVTRSRRFGMGNASVHVIEGNGDDAQVVLLNDTGHLKGECAPLSVFQARNSDG